MSDGRSAVEKRPIVGSSKEDRTPIYGGIWRYHPTKKIFEVLCHGFTNPWGMDWDEYGEAFITNTVTEQRSTTLTSAEGRQRLKEEILQGIRSTTDVKVQRVLLTDVAVQ